MKFSQYAAILSGFLATAIASEDNANGIRGLAGASNSNYKCKDPKKYIIDGSLLLKNSAVHRSARIDQITAETQCVNTARFMDGMFGATFCNGDTFSIGATPFYDEYGVEMGYFTRSETRVPLFDPREGENHLIIGNAFNVFIFHEYGDQLHFQGTDQAGAPLLTTSIAGGTGEYIGKNGHVYITDFLKPTDVVFEVCFGKQ